MPSEKGDSDLVILAAWAQFRVTVSNCMPLSTDTLHIAEDEWGNHTSTTKGIEIFANIVMLDRRSIEDPKYENWSDTRVLSCAFASSCKVKAHTMVCHLAGNLSTHKETDWKSLYFPAHKQSKCYIFGRNGVWLDLESNNSKIFAIERTNKTVWSSKRH